MAAVPVFRITSKLAGMGSFLCPPGHPSHRYGIEEKSSNRHNAYALGSYGLDTEAEWIPEGIKRRAAKMLADAQLVESPLWVAHVYGYFRRMYAPDGKIWTDASSLMSGAPGTYPDDWHAGGVHVRKYFPEHVTRVDLIADPGRGYGSYPCVHCGHTVQYDARYDAYAVFGHDAACADSTDGHSITPAPVAAQ